MSQPYSSLGSVGLLISLYLRFEYIGIELFGCDVRVIVVAVDVNVGSQRIGGTPMDASQTSLAFI